MNDRVPIEIVLNGATRRFDVRMHDSLLDVLRRERHVAVKRVCETADCGACSVLVDGRLIDSCSTLALQADGSRVDTPEGLAPGDAMHPLQQAFLDHAAAQCGFCIPGMILSMHALLDRNPRAGEAEMREVMTLCRCTGYVKPLAAVRAYQTSLLASDSSRETRGDDDARRSNHTAKEPS